MSDPSIADVRSKYVPAAHHFPMVGTARQKAATFMMLNYNENQAFFFHATKCEFPFLGSAVQGSYHSKFSPFIIFDYHHTTVLGFA